MYEIGGGPIKNIEHGHFWKVAIVFVLLVGGIWAWHYYKIRHDARLEDIANQQFQAQQKNAQPSRGKGAILPK